VMEETNARYLARLPEPVDFVSIDAAFISLKLLLPAAQGWLAGAPAEIVALIKPQFEAGRAEVSRGGGVIRDPRVHQRVLVEVLNNAAALGLAVRGLRRSPLVGPKGNAEFLAWLTGAAGAPAPQLTSLIDAALAADLAAAA
ncbi:MAG: hypothetical protein KA764_09395, partial [Anaerolineales bacterium]|nr:hypothetical protein [Anaerolineales bacterium]